MPIRPRPSASRKPVTMNGSAAGSTMLDQSCRSRAAERAADLDQLRVDVLDALIGVDHHREEREQEQDDHLGGISKPAHSTISGTSATDGIE